MIQPGQSWDVAYDAAAPGSALTVAVGHHGSQSVNGSKSEPVTFKMQAGADMDRLTSSATGVVYRDLNADTFTISGSNTSIVGGDIGPSLSNSTNGQQQPNISNPSNQVLIEGVYFHDHNQAGGFHTECLQIGGGSNVTIRRSTFRNCAGTASLHVGRYVVADPVENVTIENNFFYGNAGSSLEPLGNIQYNRDVGPGLVIRYNTFVGSGDAYKYSVLTTFDTYPETFNPSIVGNLSHWPGHSQPDGYGPCDSRAVYSYNVWRGASCSSTDRNVADIGVVSLATDLHLAAGSPAIGRGDPSNYPTVDIDGDIRSGVPDAGGDEVGSVSPPPPADTTPPTQPAGLNVTASTQTSVSLVWLASTDNVGVQGYGVHVNGTLVQTRAELSATVSGLECGTAFTLALDAYDEAGNRSSKAQVTTSTAVCSGTPPVLGALISVAPIGIDATCVRGNPALPCATLNRAYALAQCGDVVEVAAGSYGTQRIVETPAGSACTQTITFRPAPLASPTFDLIQFGSGATTGYSSNAADNVTLRGFKVTRGILLAGDATNIVIDQFDGGAFMVNGAQNVTIKNSDWGPCDAPAGPCATRSGPAEGQNRIEGCTGCATETDNLLIESNVIHDFTISPGSGAHSECLYVHGGRNVTMRGNRIFNCTTTAMSIGEWGGELLTGTWLIENNWIGRTANAASVNLTQLPYTGTMVVRFNSFGPNSTLGSESSVPNDTGTVKAVGNIFGRWDGWCIPGGDYDYNIYVDDFGGPGGALCGDTGSVRVTAFPYVNSSALSAMDYHLGVASSADNFVPAGAPSSGIGIDYDGEVRNSQKDAGADER